MTLKLRTSLLLALTVTTAPLALVLLAVTLFWLQAEERVTRETTMAEARLMAASLESMIDESQRVLEFLVRDPSIDWNDGPAVGRVLSVYQGHFPFSRGIFLIDPEGTMVALNPDQAKVSVVDRPWFQKTLENRGFTVGEFVLSRVSGIPALPMAHVVVRGGRVIAVLGVSIDLSWYYQRVEAQAHLKDTTLTVVAKDGTVLVRYPHPDLYVGKPFPALDLLTRALEGEEGVGTFPGLDGVVRLYSIEPLRVAGHPQGAITVGVPIEIIQERTLGLQTWTWVAVIVTVTFTAFFSAVGVRRVALRPLVALAEHTQKLASGDFGVRVGDRRLPGELAELARAINTMAESLEKRDQELGSYRAHLEDMVAGRTAELEASRTELQRSNAELQQFAYVASHDLQEPLRMVASFTQLLEKKYGNALDDQGRQYIRFAFDGATRMQRLINDLLAYSRVETQALALAPVSTSDAVALALQNLGLFLRERKADVVVDPLPTVLGDRGQLVQVFQNLISNGVKFNRSEVPRVVVTSRPRGDLIEFAVEDNGIGIEPQFRERVFVIFQRLNSREEYSGTGIGLSICRRIVEKHGGALWHEDAPQGGSRFVFTLKPKEQEG